MRQVGGEFRLERRGPPWLPGRLAPPPGSAASASRRRSVRHSRRTGHARPDRCAGSLHRLPARWACSRRGALRSRENFPERPVIAQRAAGGKKPARVAPCTSSPPWGRGKGEGGMGGGEGGRRPLTPALSPEGERGRRREGDFLVLAGGCRFRRSASRPACRRAWCPCPRAPRFPGFPGRRRRGSRCAWYCRGCTCCRPRSPRWCGHPRAAARPSP